MAASFSLFKHSSVGDLLGYAFRLYRARFGVFVLTAAVFYIPWTVISVLFTGAFTTGPLSGPYGEPSLDILQSLTVGAFVTLALTVQSIEALHSRSLTVGEGIRRGLSRFCGPLPTGRVCSDGRDIPRSLDCSITWSILHGNFLTFRGGIHRGCAGSGPIGVCPSSGP